MSAALPPVLEESPGAAASHRADNLSVSPLRANPSTDGVRRSCLAARSRMPIAGLLECGSRMIEIVVSCPEDS